MCSFHNGLMELIVMIDTPIGTLSFLMYVCAYFNVCLCSDHMFLLLHLIYFVKQINMKGLDGIQGPIYVGTGCVFRRQALYGYDAPKKKPPSRTCNCWPKLCCSCCCGSRKKKSKQTKEKKPKHRETSKQIHALENIEEGIERKTLFIFIFLLVT